MTVIVMLILAGVSLNALVGDNGIITNAQNANIKQKVAELEEYIHEYYVRNYDSFGKYPTNIGALKSIPNSSNWIYTGKFGYVIDKANNLHYFLNCEKLPNEMKKIIGDTPKREYADYVDCKNVWGITEDLKVYYCDNGLEDMYSVSDIVLGKENGATIAFSADSTISKLLYGEDSDKNVSIADLRSQTILNLDGRFDNLNDLYNFTSLNKLVLSNMNLDSLEGLEYNTNLIGIFIQKTTIGDYSTLAKLPNLKHIYFYNTTDDEIRKFCDNNVGIGNKNLKSLTHLGIYGAQHFIYLYNDDGSQYDSDATARSEVTNISCLSYLSSETKERITHLYLNNNKIENIDNLYEFTNLKLLRLETNNIVSLNGIYNVTEDRGITNIEYLFARRNQLGKEIESRNLNPATDALRSFSKVTLKANNSYEFSKVLNKISILDLGLNNSLVFIDYLQTCSSLKRLWLDGCSSLSNNSVLVAANVINGAESFIDSDFEFYLASADNNITRFEIGTREMTTTEFENLFKDKTKLYRLKLDGLVIVNENGEAITNYNAELNATLKKLTSIKFLSLYGLEGVTSLDFLKTVGGTIRQMDLRGTKATDMETIDDYCPKIVSLAIDYGDIDTKKLQGVWDRCSYNYRHNVFGDGKSYDSEALFEAYDCGIFMQNAELINQTKDWTDITTIPPGHNNKKITDTSGVWDFRQCTNLQGEVMLKSCTWGNIYLPTHIYHIGYWSGWVNNWEILNIDDLTNITSFYSSTMNDKVKNIINSLENLTKLDLYWVGDSLSLSELDNPENFETLWIYEYTGSQENGLTDGRLDDLGKFVNLKDLRLYYQRRLTKIPEGIEKCTKLEHLEMWNTNIASLYPLRNLSELNYLRIHDTPLYETSFYTYNDGTTINNVDNMEILANLYAKKLRTLWLARTNITDFSKITGENFRWQNWNEVYSGF